MQTVQGQPIDLGRVGGDGYAAWRNDDGSILIYDINPPYTTLGTIASGGKGEVKLPNGRLIRADGSGTVRVEVPQQGTAGPAGSSGVPAGGADTPAPEAPPPKPSAAAALVQPQVGTGRYPATQGGQTVAPSTWSTGTPGRNPGAGSIGAGTAGQQYGYGVPGFGKAPIKINEQDLPHLGNEQVAPGYIPGSGTYNQYDLSKGGLFASMPLKAGGTETVNTRFGLGGTGDPTTGQETQTPQRYITGNMADSGQAQQGDEAWRKQHGSGGGAEILPMQGGYPVQQYQEVGTGGGEGGMGGGEDSFFGSTVTSNWGQTPETQGKDYIGTLFLRSDTTTGIGTPAWSAPKAMWDGLAQEIAAGRITIKKPEAWAMLAEKGYTPQTIGGKASDPSNVQPGAAGAAGAAGALTGQAGQQWGGTLAEGTATPLGPITGGLPGGFGVEWQKLIQAQTKQAGDQAIAEAQQTGKFNGLPTVEAQKLAETIRHQAEQDRLAEVQENRALREQIYSEAFRNAQTTQNQQKISGDIKYQEEQIRVKEREIDDARRTGDLDRAQRETESLREMQQKMTELLGYAQNADGTNGQATIAMQEFLAKQQQDAYTRAANPALAFENELARGATGWNAPGVTPGMAGIPGVTAPGQSLDAWSRAGGYAQTAQPQTGAQQAGGYGYGTTPGADQSLQAWQAAQAQAAQAQAAQAQQVGAGAGMAAAAAQNPFLATSATGPAALVAGLPSAPAVPGMAGTTAGQTGQGQTTGQPALDQTAIRTPAAVNAFKMGLGTSTTGQYGAPTTVESGTNAPITGAQVRQQNLKQTRKLSPLARMVVGSFAKAGGTDDDTFKQFADRKAPGASTAGSSYAMR